MIISHKYRFIFIKTLKTAGTSIEIFLSQHCGPSDIVTPIHPHVIPHRPRNYSGYRNHDSAHVIRRKIGAKQWDSYFKFCVERNPWDKTLSHYHMMKGRHNQELTFDRYLDGNNFAFNIQKYTEPGDSSHIIVDRIIYYEQLIGQLGHIFRELDISFPESLGVNAKSEYRADRRPYQQVYTPTQALRIRSLFKKEILLHGYRF